MITLPEVTHASHMIHPTGVLQYCTGPEQDTWLGKTLTGG